VRTRQEHVEIYLRKTILLNHASSASVAASHLEFAGIKTRASTTSHVHKGEGSYAFHYEQQGPICHTPSISNSLDSLTGA